MFVPVPQTWPSSVLRIWYFAIRVHPVFFLTLLRTLGPPRPLRDRLNLAEWGLKRYILFYLFGNKQVRWVRSKSQWMSIFVWFDYVLGYPKKTVVFTIPMFILFGSDFDNMLFNQKIGTQYIRSLLEGLPRYRVVMEPWVPTLCLSYTTPLREQSEPRRLGRYPVDQDDSTSG